MTHKVLPGLVCASHLPSCWLSTSCPDLLISVWNMVSSSTTLGLCFFFGLCLFSKIPFSWSSLACILWSFISQTEWLLLRDTFLDDTTKVVPSVLLPHVNPLYSALGNLILFIYYFIICFSFYNKIFNKRDPLLFIYHCILLLEQNQTHCWCPINKRWRIGLLNKPPPEVQEVWEVAFLFLPIWWQVKEVSFVCWF